MSGAETSLIRRLFPDADPKAATVVLALIVLCLAIEAGLWGSDLGLWGQTRVRHLAYEYGGFWPGLLADWRSNYPGQAAIMFLSYSFLHGGPGHAVVNMVTLWSLGGGVAARSGAGGFALLYTGAALGGALGYGLLAQSAVPMVGASGALFGLAGALMAWAYRDRKDAWAGLWPLIQVGLFLIALNLAMYWALEGQLAWQTHLGGFLTGWALAFLIGGAPAANRPPRARG